MQHALPTNNFINKNEYVLKRPHQDLSCHSDKCLNDINMSRKCSPDFYPHLRKQFLKFLCIINTLVSCK